MQTRSKWLLFAALLLALWFLWGPRWRQYPPVSSPEALTLIKLFYNASSARDPQRMVTAQQRLKSLIESGQLTPAEQTAFERVVTLIQKQEWERAQRACLQFADDQIGLGAAANSALQPR